MKKITLTLLLPLVLLSSSCRKTSGPTTVEGTVVDMYTGKAVPLAHIIMEISTIGSGGGASRQKMAYADKDGKFSFSFEASSSQLYEVFAGVENRYFPPAGDFQNIERGHKNTGLIIECQPVGWVRVNIVNTEPRDSIEYINMEGFWKPRSFALSYTNKDTSFVSLCLQGGDTVRLGYWVKRRNVPEEWRHIPVFLEPLDTTTINLTY